jgi:hypothetical protein
MVIAAAAIGACTPAAETPAPSAPAAEAATPAATVSLAGKWSGTITCYQADAPLQVTIDAATSDKATVAMGSDAVTTWQAPVRFNAETRMVLITSDSAMSDAAVIEGALAADNNSISGTMEKQLCRSFRLTRQP